MRHRLVLLAVMLCSHAGAQVYKCAEGGTTVYSERPCGASAKAVTVRPASGHAPAAAPDRLAARPQEPSLSDRADAAVKRRLLDDEIWRKERAVSLLYDELAARQAQLESAYGNSEKTWRCLGRGAQVGGAVVRHLPGGVGRLRRGHGKHRGGTTVAARRR